MYVVSSFFSYKICFLLNYIMIPYIHLKINRGQINGQIFHMSLFARQRGECAYGQQSAVYNSRGKSLPPIMLLSFYHYRKGGSNLLFCLSVYLRVFFLIIPASAPAASSAAAAHTAVFHVSPVLAAAFLSPAAPLFPPAPLFPAPSLL